MCLGGGFHTQRLVRAPEAVELDPPGVLLGFEVVRNNNASRTPWKPNLRSFRSKFRIVRSKRHASGAIETDVLDTQRCGFFPFRSLSSRALSSFAAFVTSPVAFSIPSATLTVVDGRRPKTSDIAASST